MWGWISKVLGLGIHVIDDTVRQWVGDLISGVFGFIHTVFGLVGHAWGDMFHAGKWLYLGVARLGVETYQTLAKIIKQIIPDVIHWATYWVHRLGRFIEEVFHWAAHEFDVIRHWVAALFDAFRKWVINDVWSPIWRTLTPVFRWVTHEGATLWYFLTHPAAFVDLIWTHLLVKLEREAWNAGRLLGRFFLSLVVHNLRTFFLLIEDVIDAIL